MAKTQLRDYQLHYKQEVNNRFSNSAVKRLLMVMPTGTGKTTVFSSMTFDYVTGINKVLLIVHRIELVDQIVSRLLDFGVRAGVIAGDYPLDLNLGVQVGMIQSFSEEIKWRPDYIIIDECHHSPAGTYVRLWERFPDARILGVTATPVRTDNKGFDDLYEDMIDLYPMSWFFERNYLVKPKHYICGNFNLQNKISTSGIEYDLVEMAKEMRTNKQIGDVLTSYKIYSPGRRAVVFAVNVEHSKDICERFNQAGIKAAHIDGVISKQERKEIIKKFTDGEIKVLCNYDIISEGFDVPAIETVILARRSKSLSWYLQSVGRCLRPAGGKQYGYVLDCANAWLEFGPSGMDYKWNIEGGKEQVLDPMGQTKMFLQKDDIMTPVISRPEELEGVDLVEMCNKLKRLAEFEFYFNDQKKNERDFAKAVELYHASLQFRGFDMTNFEVIYCKKMLESEGVFLGEYFWSGLLSKPELA